MSITRSWTTILTGIALVGALGCGKKAEVTTSRPDVPAANTATPVATAGGVTPTSAPVAGADTTARLVGAAWAVMQDQIKNDPNGQWATSAIASSTYGDAKEMEDWAPNHVAGAPDVEKYVDDRNAWAPKTEDGGLEWIEASYAKPVFATAVRVRESCGSGSIIRIELIDEAGQYHPVWAGVDPTTELNYLMVNFPKTPFKAIRVKITLATNTIPGWNEIDAIQLVGSTN